MKRNMNRMLGTVVGSALALLVAGQVQAAGTTADTTISNTASVTFTIGGGTPPPVDSNTVEFEVDRKVAVVVANTDSGNVIVVPGKSDNVLTFTVTNNSNTAAGIDYFHLSTVADAGRDFDMGNVRIYADTGSDVGVLDGTDVLLDATNNDRYYGINVDTTVNFLVVADTPSDGTANAKNDLSGLHLVATAWNGTLATDGEMLQDTELSPPNNTNDPTLSEIYFYDGTGTSGDGDNDGIHSARGTYETNWTDLDVTKTESSATGYHIPGDIVTYTITVKNSDTASDATSVLISDQIPANTTFETGTLNCNSLSGSSEQYSASAKGTALASIVWEGTETSTVNFVGCSGGTIVKNDGTDDGEGSMTFQVAID